MEVWVDGKNNFRVDGSPADWLSVFRAVSDFLREHSRMPVEVKLNGAGILPLDLRKSLENVTIGDADKLEVRSEEIGKLVDECLGQIDASLDELPVACRALAEVFQGEAPAEGFEPFQHIAEIWEHIKHQERLVASALDIELEAVEIGGATVGSLSAELNSFLEEAAQALSKNDAVALGDLLEYELAPRAEQEAAIVGWLRERAAALPR